MTPERAGELLTLSDWKNAGCLAVGAVRPDIEDITDFERKEVNRVWDTLKGNTCFNDALRRIALGHADLLVTFPLYKRHQDAKCFNCGASLKGVKHEDTGFPPTEGRWKKYCGRCDTHTAYDVV